MTRLIGVLLTLGVVGTVANPAPADAQGSDLEYETVRCANEAVASCDQDFPPNDWRLVAARGWCYMIRTAQCLGSDEDTTPTLEG